MNTARIETELCGLGIPPAVARYLASRNFASQDELAPASGGPLEDPYKPIRKQTLIFDQNALETATWKTNVATYETNPGDGSKLDLSVSPHPLKGTPGSPNTCGLGDFYWTATAVPWPAWATALSNVQTTEFIQFQEMFLELKIHPSTTASPGVCGWFNPVFIRSVIHNTRMAGRFVDQAFMEGVWFDVERMSGAPVGYNPWKYSEQFLSTYRCPSYLTAKSMDEYKARVFYCGRLWAHALVREKNDIKILFSFLYGWATEGETSTYGLLGSFYDGVFYQLYGARIAPKVYEWGEEMYNRSGIAGESTTHPTEVGYFLNLFRDGTYIELPAHCNTPYYRARSGSALRMDAAPFVGDTALLQAGVENHIDASDEYVTAYQETARFFDNTASVAQKAAWRAARVSRGLEAAFDPRQIPGLVSWIKWSDLGLADGAAIPATFLDKLGNTWTAVNGPTYTATGVGGAGGVDLVAASLQYLTCHPAASQFSGTDVPYTIVYAQDFGTLPAGTVCMFSLGSSTDADPRISVRYTATPLLTSQRVSDTGTSDIGFGTAPQKTPTTAAAIVALNCDGALGISMTYNGSHLLDASARGWDPQATIGAQTFDRMTLGALLQNSTPSQYFDDPVGDFYICNRSLGSEEMKYIVQGTARTSYPNITVI